MPGRRRHIGGARGRAAATLLICGVVITSSFVRAAPNYVYRSIVLPQGNLAADLGLGIARVPTAPTGSVTGLGMNLELAGGISPGLELGFRTGLRFEWEGRATRADSYGRTWDRETFGVGWDRVANPELRVRWSVARGPGAQLGLELRAYLPFEANTDFGIMLGAPLALHLGMLRIDSGIFVPIIFDDPGTTAVSVPFHLWFAAGGDVWLGPLLGFRIVNSDDSRYKEYPFGFGLGIGLNSAVDFRTWFLFPQIKGEDATRTFGVGLGLQIRG